MSSGIPVIKFVFGHEWKVLTLALNSDPNFEIEDIDTAKEAATYLSSVKAALVLCSLSSKEDLIQIATLMKIYKKFAPDTVVKIIVANFSSDRSFERAIAKLGIQDVVDPGINTKALRYKIDFWMKGLVAQSKKAEANIAAKTKKEASKTGNKSIETKTAGPKWEEPMDCQDDIWLIKQEADCKRIMGKWLLRLMGPSPYVGQWTEINGRNNLWKFEFKNGERESFLDDDGNWFFRGDQKPDFVWKENVWLITGSQFDLYYQNSKQIISRLSLKDKILTICKNSEYAKTKESIIIESFDKEMVFKKDGSGKSTQEVDTEGGTDKIKNLEGKGKTDRQNNGPLSGKTKGGDHLTSDLLAMDLEPDTNKQDGPLMGPASDKIKKGTELSLENKNNEHKSHYKNHNEAEKFDPSNKEPHGYAPDKENESAPMLAPSPEKVKKGAELGLENKNNEHKSHYKNHNEAETFDPSNKEPLGYAPDKESESGPMWAPSSDKVKKGTELDLENKNTEHKTHYKGHNEAEKFEASEREQKGYAADKYDDLSGKLDREGKNDKEKDYGGKGSTDKLNKYYKNEEDEKSSESSPEKERELKRARKEELEKRARAIQERNEREGRNQHPQPNDGESSGPDLSKKKESETDSKKQKGIFTDDVTGNMGGRSSTDKMDAHYKKKAPNELDDEEDEEESDSLNNNQLRKKVQRREKEARILNTSGKKNEHGSTDKKKEDSKDSEPIGSLHSIEEARKVKELENVLNEEEDPEMEVACESGQILSYLQQNNFKIACKLDDFFDQTIIFCTTEPGIDASSEVDLDLRFIYLEKDMQLNLQGMVTNLDHDDEGGNYITVEINDESVTAFKSFMEIYQERQKNISFFLNRVKGL